MWGSWCVFNVWAWDLSRDICHQPCEIPAKFAAEFSFSAFARGFSVPKFAFGANLLFPTVIRVFRWRGPRPFG